MAKVRFEPAGYEVEVAPGTALVHVCEEHPDAEVPFSCYSASCGTCRCKVVSGMENLSKPEDDELAVLEAFGDGPDVRLACQMILVADGPVQLVVADSSED